MKPAYIAAAEQLNAEGVSFGNLYFSYLILYEISEHLNNDTVEVKRFQILLIILGLGLGLGKNRHMAEGCFFVLMWFCWLMFSVIFASAPATHSDRMYISPRFRFCQLHLLS